MSDNSSYQSIIEWDDLWENTPLILKQTLGVEGNYVGEYLDKLKTTGDDMKRMIADVNVILRKSDGMPRNKDSMIYILQRITEITGEACDGIG